LHNEQATHNKSRATRMLVTTSTSCEDSVLPAISGRTKKWRHPFEGIVRTAKKGAWFSRDSEAPQRCEAVEKCARICSTRGWRRHSGVIRTEHCNKLLQSPHSPAQAGIGGVVRRVRVTDPAGDVLTIEPGPTRLDCLSAPTNEECLGLQHFGETKAREASELGRLKDVQCALIWRIGVFLESQLFVLGVQGNRM
jgi:hypothetical protein